MLSIPAGSEALCDVSICVLTTRDRVIYGLCVLHVPSNAQTISSTDESSLQVILANHGGAWKSPILGVPFTQYGPPFMGMSQVGLQLQ